MKPDASRGKLPLDYFVLVFALAVPFWLFGGGRLPLPINLPVGALVTFVPLTNKRKTRAGGIPGDSRVSWTGSEEATGVCSTADGSIPGRRARRERLAHSPPG